MKEITVVIFDTNKVKAYQVVSDNPITLAVIKYNKYPLLEDKTVIFETMQVPVALSI